MSTIEIEGSLAHTDEVVTVTVYGRERIAAVLAAANRHLTDTDEMTTRLAVAVERDEDMVELPDVRDKHDAAVIADVLDDFRNGDDGSGRRAASKLRTLPTRTVRCPTCDGSGEVAA